MTTVPNTTLSDDDHQLNPPELARSTRERKKPSFYGQEYIAA